MIEDDLEIAALMVEIVKSTENHIKFMKASLTRSKKHYAACSALMATSLKELFIIEDLVTNFGYKGKIYASAPLTRGGAEGFGQSAKLHVIYVDGEWTMRRLKQLMENVVRVVERRRPSRLRQIRSMQWLS